MFFQAHTKNRNELPVNKRKQLVVQTKETRKDPRKQNIYLFSLRTHLSSIPKSQTLCADSSVPPPLP